MVKRGADIPTTLLFARKSEMLIFSENFQVEAVRLKDCILFLSLASNLSFQFSSACNIFCPHQTLMKAD